MRATIEKEKQLTFTAVEHAYPELYEQARQLSAKELGAVAVANTVSLDLVDETATLKTTIAQARQGDMQAYMSLEANVATDVAERLFKAAHVSSVTLQSTPEGLSQNGRSSRDIHKNAYQHMDLNSVMLERTKLEHQNAVLFDLLHAHDVLDTHDALLFEMTPFDELTRQKYNFFTNTDSISTQYLSKQSGGQYVLETAMIAGKTSPYATRHDARVIRSILTSSGLEIEDMSDNESVKHMLLLPKGQVSGVQDIVKQVDDVVGGTFYGQAMPIQDYERHRLVCEQRSLQFNDVVAEITNELLAGDQDFRTPMDALKKLDELSDKYCVQYALTQKDIDLAVFGKAAAEHIEHARSLAAAGDSGGAEGALAAAHEVSTSGSCPTSFSSTTQQNESDAKSGSSLNASSGLKRMTCPYCGEQTVGDPCAAAISCGKCRASTRLTNHENKRRAKNYHKRKAHAWQKGILFSWPKKK